MFWFHHYSSIYPGKLDMRGKSRLRVAVVERMCNAVIMDCKTHFRSGFFRLMLYLMGEDADKKEASRITHNTFMGVSLDIWSYSVGTRTSQTAL